MTPRRRLLLLGLCSAAGAAARHADAPALRAVPAQAVWEPYPYAKFGMPTYQWPR